MGGSSCISGANRFGCRFKEKELDVDDEYDNDGGLDVRGCSSGCCQWLAHSVLSKNVLSLCFSFFGSSSLCPCHCVSVYLVAPCEPFHLHPCLTWPLPLLCSCPAAGPPPAPALAPVSLNFPALPHPTPPLPLPCSCMSHASARVMPPSRQSGNTADRSVNSHSGTELCQRRIFIAHVLSPICHLCNLSVL